VQLPLVAHPPREQHIIERVERQFDLPGARLDLDHPGLAVVAGREGKRKPETEPVVPEFDPGHQLEPHAYLLAGPQVAHAEVHAPIAIRPCQRGQVPLLDRAFVCLPRLLDRRSSERA